jgi:hypothetical protein
VASWRDNAEALSRQLLRRDKALIFRITHVANLPWLLDHGLHCRNSAMRNPAFVSIGHPELIARREGRLVPIFPGGCLSDYIPFYFTPWSPMLYNIKTGVQGVRRLPMSDIAILVSSTAKLDAIQVRYLITDRHAYLHLAEFTAGVVGLDRIDWQRLRSRSFRRDPEDPESFERYQAEVLVHRHLPCDGLLGIACYSDSAATSILGLLQARRSKLKLVVRPEMFF